MLVGIETRVADVQRELGDLLPADAILVGHSIANDLKALKVCSFFQLLNKSVGE